MDKAATLHRFAFVDIPNTLPLSTSAFFTHSCSVGGEEPIFSAMETTVALLSLSKGRWMIRLVIQYHPDRSCPHFGRKLVHCPDHNGSFYSGVGASDNPGGVQIAYNRIMLNRRIEG
jgi:hypothetical protein